MIWVLHHIKKVIKSKTKLYIFLFICNFMMSIDNLFFYVLILCNGGLCEYAINLFNCSFIHILIFSFFLCAWNMYFAKSFEVYYFLSVFVSCVVEMTVWNSSLMFLVIDETVEAIGQFWWTRMINTLCTFRIFNVRKKKYWLKYIKKRIKK
jgi:hypothetical protein